ncbi:MAG: FMN-binding protein, partial [Verrucomicrobiales bacterium]
MTAGARALWLRIYRGAIVAGIVLMIHREAPPVDPDLAMGVSLELVQEYFPSAAGIGERLEEHGGHFVLDAGRNQLGFVVATSPDSDHIVGYSGPNNVLVAFGADGKALGISVLSSGDTTEHVDEVLADERFMGAFDGKTWEEIQAMQRVDGVSGATLTSLAIAEGIIRRVAGSAPSLRFPEPLALADAQRVFPSAVELGEQGEVFGPGGVQLGSLLSTAPHSDSLIGYAGPSEVLVGVAGESDEIVGIVIRDTYDTEKYVGYVRDEAGFIEMFNGRALRDLAGFDLEANEVEGVSGATMTSMTVARAVVALAEAESRG